MADLRAVRARVAYMFAAEGRQKLCRPRLESSLLADWLTEETLTSLHTSQFWNDPPLLPFTRINLS